ncbi:MAG: hypothetical protein ABH986_06180 [archaeon]
MNSKVLTAITIIFFAAIACGHSLEGNFSGLTFQGETVPSVFYLCNSSDSSTNFHLTSDNSWMQVRPLSVYLAGNSCEEVYAFTTPNPFAQAGNYEINLSAISDNSITTKTFYLTVAQGHKIIVNALNQSINSTQCKKQVFEFELKNTGIFDERALISVKGLNENWFELSSEEILLPKNSARNIELSVLIPCNQETKNYEFSLATELKNTGIIKKSSLSLKVENAQEILLENKAFTACNDLKSNAFISVKNNGLLEDEILLQIQGPDWVSVKQPKLVLQPGETKQVEIEFNQTNAETKNHSIVLNAVSEKFSQVYSKQFSIELQNCFELSIEKAAWNETACLESKPEVSYIIKNNGSKETALQLSIQGVQAQLEKNSVILLPGQSIEAKAVIDFSAVSAVGEIKFVLIADSENYTKSFEAGITAEKCYGISSLAPSIEVCKGVPLTGQFISVKNTGTKKELFSVASDVSWVQPKTGSFELNGGEEKKIELEIIPQKNSAETVYSVTAKTDNAQNTRKAKITFLNNTTCFGITMTNLKNSVDVNAGEGTINTIKVTNNGLTIQKISFSVKENDWVYFNPKEFNLDKGETKEVYVYFNPPFDFSEETAVVTVKAQTDFGFTAEKKVEVNVSGGSIVLTINPEDIKVNSTGIEAKDTNQNVIEIKIEVANNTATSMKILDVKSNYPETSYFIEDPVIKKAGKGEIILKFTASEKLDLSGLEVPIEIVSDKGTFYKVVTLPETTETTEKESDGSETGFVLFGEDQYILVILVVIVIILIIMAAVRSDKEDASNETVIDYSDSKGKDFQQEMKELITKKPKPKAGKKAKKRKK